jgi:hypothetical protein
LTKANQALVVNALRKHNLDVVAIHHPMLGEQPGTVFLHYYGGGAGTDLARGLRAVPDELANRKPAMKH